jgi:hypothetical protein
MGSLLVAQIAVRKRSEYKFKYKGNFYREERKLCPSQLGSLTNIKRDGLV